MTDKRLRFLELPVKIHLWNTVPPGRAVVGAHEMHSAPGYGGKLESAASAAPWEFVNMHE